MEASKDIGQLALSHLAARIRKSRPSGEFLIVEGNLRTAWLEETCQPGSHGDPATFLQVQSRPAAMARSGSKEWVISDPMALGFWTVD